MHDFAWYYWNWHLPVFQNATSRWLLHSEVKNERSGGYVTRVVFPIISVCTHPIFHSVVCCVVSILLSKFVEKCLMISSLFHVFRFPLDVFFFSFRAAFMTYLQGALMGRMMQVFYADVLILISGSCHVVLLLHVRNVFLFLWLVCLTWFRFTQVMPERNAEGVVFVFLLKCTMFFRNPANTWLSALLLCLFILNKPIKALRYAWFNILGYYLFYGTDISETTLDLGY